MFILTLIMARNYKRENLYKAQPKQIQAREDRNRARHIMQEAGLVHKGDGLQVDHIVPISKGGKTIRSNLRVVTASTNDSFKRNSQKQLINQESVKERSMARSTQPDDKSGTKPKDNVPRAPFGVGRKPKRK
jgi:hypothetical protein